MMQLAPGKKNANTHIRSPLRDDGKIKYHHSQLTDNEIEGLMKYWSTEEPSHVVLFLQMMDKRGLL